MARTTPAKRGARRRGGGEEASEYERQRQERIRENKERIQALGLLKLSTSLRYPGGEFEKKKKEEEEVGNEDDEYRPSDDGDSSEGEEDGSCSGSRRKPKQKRNNMDDMVKASSRKELFAEVDAMELDEDVAIKKAIALSLGEPAEESKICAKFSKPSRDASVSEAYGKGRRSEKLVRGKRKKGNVARVQLTQDEAVPYFFSFDLTGKGKIGLHDLRRLAIEHDFSWTEKEMADMIHCFDDDRDGRLTLDDFYGILSRCNLVQEPGRS